jgi:preprotein translocase subunit SecB
MGKLLTIIDGPRLTACSFATRPIEKKSDKKLGVNLKSFSKIELNDKEDTAIISWFIQSDSTSVPFKFDVSVAGLFKVARNATKKEIIEATKIEAGPLLVVALREIVSDLTRRAEVTPFYLSYPDFASLRGVERKKNRVSKEKKKSIA